MSNQPSDGRRSKPGAEPIRIDLVFAERGLGPAPDATLMARSDGVAIWHTEKVAAPDVPWWLPPFTSETELLCLYRGFAIDNLRNVLEHGLDVPPQCAFFATPSSEKAWEYPHSRELAAMLVLDSDHALPSYARKPDGADDSWRPDNTLYPNTYTDGGRVIHTRFGDGRGTRTFMDELMYGRWVPGDARDALIAVVLGGPRLAVRERLEDMQGSGLYGLELQ